MILDLMVDYDDVIYPWTKYAHRICDEAGITNGNTINSWHFWQDYGCTEDEVWDALIAAGDSLYDQPIIPGTTAALNRLRYMGHRVHIVTARGVTGPQADRIRLLTHEQIIRENIPLDTLTFTKDKPSVRYFHAGIDDGVHNYEALEGVGTHMYLMHQPHNASEPGVRRVHSLNEFVNHIAVVTEAIRSSEG